METTLTELDAINIMLRAISESPVSSLDETLVDVAKAQDTLNDVSRCIQEIGWPWNQEREYQLLSNLSDEVEIPGNVLEIDPSPSECKDYVQRGNKFYDRENHTFTITDNVKVDITWFLPYEDLPSPAKTFVAYQAALEFQQSILGSEVRDNYIRDHARRAWRKLKKSANQVGDRNILTGNYSTFKIINRGGYASSQR